MLGGMAWLDFTAAALQELLTDRCLALLFFLLLVCTRQSAVLRSAAAGHCCTHCWPLLHPLLGVAAPNPRRLHAAAHSTCTLLAHPHADHDLLSLRPHPAGYTPLHMAAGYMHTSTIAALLAGGADPEQEDRQGRRCAHHHCSLLTEPCSHHHSAPR